MLLGTNSLNKTWIGWITPDNLDWMNDFSSRYLQFMFLSHLNKSGSNLVLKMQVVYLVESHNHLSQKIILMNMKIRLRILWFIGECYWHDGKFKRNHVLLMLRSLQTSLQAKLLHNFLFVGLIRPIYGVLPFSSVYQ